MLATARNCGCPIHDQSQAPRTSSSTYSYSNSAQSCPSSLSTATDSCGCGSESTISEEPKPKLVSEIASKGLPYKEIETIFNNNSVVVRLQTEKPKEEFDPPCDCIEPETKDSQKSFDPLMSKRSDIVFQKARPGCRTISVYPNPDQKNPETAAKNQLPTVNPEENPNIFVLKIKRKCDKRKLDLEFRSPRPWRTPKCE